MITGIELAGLVLAIFPLVIAGLEAYQEGLQTMKEWIRFRAEFLSFLNALARQKIFFRQNIEDLLSSVVGSEYEMACMLDDPRSGLWQKPDLEEKLRLRLSGKYEYEAYLDTASSIRDILDKLIEKLKITSGEHPWLSQSSSKGMIRLEYEYRRLTHVLSKKRRSKLTNSLEKYNDDLQKLLGNSNRLEPLRKKRKSAMPELLYQIRNQATGLHAALMQAWRCDCRTAHSTKLILAKKSGNAAELKPNSTIKLDLLLPRLPVDPAKDLSGPRAKEEWFATEIRMMEKNDRTPPLKPTAYQLETTSLSSGITSLRSRKISFQSDSSLLTGPAYTSATTVSASVDDDNNEIQDLCAAMNKSQIRKYLGHIRDGQCRHYNLHLALNFPFSSAHIRRVLSLDTLLGSKEDDNRNNTSITSFSRRTRLSIAVTLAHSLLHLHSGPWLNSTWGKKDVYFFQGEDGRVFAEYPFVLAEFKSWKEAKEIDNELHAEHTSTTQGSTSALLSLGIVILELWFDQKLEAQPFRTQFLGPNGEKQEYTDFNTAQKWQEKALEEAGLDLHNATRRCIFCAFGAASQDLQDEELQKAVYDEVILPLERLLSQFGAQV